MSATRQAVSPATRIPLSLDRPDRGDKSNKGEQMFIVATQDPRTRTWSEQGDSGAAAWGRYLPIDAGITQAEADAQLATYLQAVQAGEPLCIRAHGNDEEIGDAESNAKDWGWTYK